MNLAPHTPTLQELEPLLNDAEGILRKQNFLMDIDMPDATIIGDLHGDWKSYQSALSFRKGGVVFLGDIVDRGAHQIEILTDILRSIILEEGKIFFLRGNHETKEINATWGFRSELHEKYGMENGEFLWDRINKTFGELPICAVLNRKYFLTHGCIAEGYQKLGDIRRRGGAKRLMEKDLGLIWNDPQEMPQRFDFIHNTYRGRGKRHRDSVAEEFCARSGLEAIIRGHEWGPKGVWWNKNHRVLTVFSIPGYRANNMGGVVTIEKNDLHLHKFI